ncbi:helix-turn-helix domain-containing protein [Rhizobium jaguaris]|uniref:AraC family transcriptional regulator n=1 Tax=Rhizobium jaguaris TaxID=1312183 RepID=A0A387FWR0_9HYPH|nr:AraC family transcriptional regulator [Rhizobium jaguaris]AYG59962.1 AraC family transcriptional regulator [Rhizobium jaguaris]
MTGIQLDVSDRTENQAGDSLADGDRLTRDSGVGELAVRRFGVALSGRLNAKSATGAAVAFARLIAPPSFSLGDISAEDAYSLHVNCISHGLLRIAPGRANEQKHHIPLSGIAIYDLADLQMMEMDTRFDMIRFHFPRHSLQDAAREMGHKQSVRITRPPIGTIDPIISGIASTVAACFQYPDRAPQLFLDQLGIAVQTHLLHNYNETAIASPRKRGGLLPWQEKRAKELIAAELSKVSMAKVAEECGLSSSYFVRAFRETMGMPPHHWLSELRIAMAKDMLDRTSEPLNAVALACGFSDQSHLGREFVRRIGMPPGQWRRRHQRAR